MRKTMNLKLVDDGHEIEFRITQMPATTAEKFLITAGTIIAGTGLLKLDQMDDGAEVLDAFIGAVLRDGLESLGKLDVNKLDPLNDMIYSCVEHKVDNSYLQVNAENIDAKIAEVKTLFALKKEVIKFNFGFFMDGGAPALDSSNPSAPNSKKPLISRKS